MRVFASTIIGILLFGNNLSYSIALSSTTTTYEVCLSPGCIADGAEATFHKLQALAPAGVTIKEGGCCSLCSNGPLVMCPTKKDTTIKHKRVKGKKVLDLLLSQPGNNDEDGTQTLPVIPETLIQGYEMSVEAEDALQSKDYEHAVSLYERAINTAFRAALDMQTAREKAGNDDNLLVSETGIPVGLLWLVTARRNEATARMALGDLNGAVLAAQASCNIGRNRCPESLQTLAAIYEKEGDASAELQALNNLFELPLDKANMSRQVENKRRELGFRRDKLQREVQ